MEKFKQENKEKEPSITIKRSTEAPKDAKNNPFYDPEIWGRADSINEFYLPESDEAISFALAVHEIGHLVKAGKEKTSLDNFESVKKEELRAWKQGMVYLEKYIDKYYEDQKDFISKIKDIIKEIEKLMMEAVELSKPLYLKKGKLDGVDEEEYNRILAERREMVFKSNEGGAVRDRLQSIKNLKIGKIIEWDKFVSLVRSAVLEIDRDNKKLKG